MRHLACLSDTWGVTMHGHLSVPASVQMDGSEHSQQLAFRASMANDMKNDKRR